MSFSRLNFFTETVARKCLLKSCAENIAGSKWKPHLLESTKKTDSTTSVFFLFSEFVHISLFGEHLWSLVFMQHNGDTAKT